MIQYILLLTPGIISLQIDKLIKKQEIGNREYFEKYVMYTILITFVSLLTLVFWIKGSPLWSIILDDVEFCLKYLFMNILYALFLPIVVNFILDNVSFKIIKEKRDNNEEV